MTEYTLSGREALEHKPKFPERMTRRYHAGLNFDVTFKVWRTRQALARAIRKQERRAAHYSDWKAVVPLSPGEGY